MLTAAQINSRLANLGLRIEVRRHTGGGGFYIVSTRGGRETILNSAMGIDWVNEWAAQWFRDFFRTYVSYGHACYPELGGEPLFCWTTGQEREAVEARWGRDVEEVRA